MYIDDIHNMNDIYDMNNMNDIDDIDHIDDIDYISLYHPIDDIDYISSHFVPAEALVSYRAFGVILVHTLFLLKLWHPIDDIDHIYDIDLIDKIDDINSHVVPAEPLASY
jgi:hypothetical protein